jgi:hypothetical protein
MILVISCQKINKFLNTQIWNVSPGGTLILKKGVVILYVIKKLGAKNDECAMK